MRKLSYLLKTTLCCVLLSHFSSALAKLDNKWYHVEVLVFESKDQSALAEEWPLEPAKPPLANAVSLNPNANGEYGILADSQLALISARQRIQKNYRLIMHQGWRQMINDKQHAQSIRLTGGKHYDSAHEIDGIIRLSSGRFLHLDTDLLFRKPMQVVAESGATARFAEIADKNNWKNAPNARLQGFHLKESSRLRTDEIQYIDHPMYGIIIMVTPEKV